MPEFKMYYEEFSSVNDVPAEDQQLIARAQEAMKDAYAPYSNFEVGCALLLDCGEIVIGSNQENVAYPSGLCAERVALFAAGSNFPHSKVVKLAIVAQGDLLDKDKTLSPCGSCRQVMAETQMRQKQSFEVMLVSQNGRILKVPNGFDLLPFVFGK